MFKSIEVEFGTAKLAPTVTAAFSEDVKQADGGKESAKRSSKPKGASARPGFKGENGETFVQPDGNVLLGLGKRAEFKPDTLRVAGARLIKKLDRLALKKVNLDLGGEALGKKIGPHMVGRCVAEGAALANWKVDMFAGTASNAKPVNDRITIHATDRKFVDGMEDGLSLAESTNYARRIAATPPNICNPQWIAEQARKLARDEGMKFTLIDFARAQKMGMGGIVNVGMGSAAKPCLIVLEHKPAKIARAAKDVRLALVGKTITYDTGGYSLKINNTMKGMKYDKCGGTAVLGAMHAIARMKLPVHVFGLLPCAENMVSESSYRPDDIITMYNGVSVEVTNTDAEGRLVLGDALAYACKDVKATAIIDLATLTGGIVTALGHFCAGVFCNDEPLLKRVNEAAESSCDKVWRMPLWKDHKEFMRAQHADILNSNASRNAHPVQGAAFLAYFVDEKIPWAHLDIAGMGNVDADKDLFVQGPTGYGVRLLIDLVRGFA